MELIDAYVTEVGRHLPEKQRTDIEREIRSMIEDTLEDESRAQGRPADQDMLVVVLKRLGSPEKMAASYAPPRYLIGPELYPMYVLVLKLVLGLVLALGAIGIAISVMLNAGFGANTNAVLEAMRSLSKNGLGLVNTAIQVVGMITLIFALIQRAAPGIKPVSFRSEFDPRKLKTVSEPKGEPFSPAGLVVEIVIALIALAVFNDIVLDIAVISPNGSRLSLDSVLTAAFFAYVPFMNIIWALEVALKGSVLVSGRWTALTLWARTGLKVLSVGLLAVMLTGPDLISLSAELVINPGSSDILAQLNQVVNLGMRLSLGIGLVVTIIEVVSTTIKQLVGKKPVVELM